MYRFNSALTNGTIDAAATRHKCSTVICKATAFLLWFAMQIATAILRNCTIKSGRPPFLDMTINFQGAVYHRAGQYINFYVLIVTWQHTYWSPTLITSPNITLWYWVSTSWQVAVKTYKSVCPALHAFRRCIVSCLQPVNTVVDHLLWLSRELS